MIPGGNEGVEALERALANLPLGGVRYFERTTSTMDDAAAWLEAGAPDLAVVIANEQTAGRGRLGRRWFTPPDSALAFSLILHAKTEAERLHSQLFTGLGALGVCQALERRLGLQPQIKWPNDVLIEGKKVCGILSEAHWQGEDLLGIILGIGINVAPPSVPPVTAVLFPAACLEDCLQLSLDRAPVGVERFELLAWVLECILEWRPHLHTPDFLQAWEARLAYRHQAVQVFRDLASDFPVLEGTLDGLNADGSLRVMTGSGEMQTVNVGEIRLRASQKE